MDRYILNNDIIIYMEMAIHQFSRVILSKGEGKT